MGRRQIPGKERSIDPATRLTPGASHDVNRRVTRAVTTAAAARPTTGASHDVNKRVTRAATAAAAARPTTGAPHDVNRRVTRAATAAAATRPTTGAPQDVNRRVTRATAAAAGGAQVDGGLVPDGCVTKGRSQKKRQRRLSELDAGQECIIQTLPEELTAEILRKLPELKDFGKAGCVCKAWNRLTSSPWSRPAISSWCLIKCGGCYSKLAPRNSVSLSWTCFDLASGVQHRLRFEEHNLGAQFGSTTAGTAPEFLQVKGDGGLIAFEQARVVGDQVGRYWICNPLLNQWQDVPKSSDMIMHAPNLTAISYGGDTYELLVDIAQPGHGPASYRILRFVPMRTPDTTIYLPNALCTQVYDSKSRVWTAGACVHLPGVVALQAPFMLRSCVWSRNIYVVEARYNEFRIWEYNVGCDTLTLIAPSASVPNGIFSTFRSPFQVQVRNDGSEDGRTVQLVTCLDSPPTVYVCTWDLSAELWTVAVQVQTSDPGPERNLLQDPASAFVPGFLAIDRARSCGRRKVRNPRKWTLSVLQEGTLAQTKFVVETQGLTATGATLGLCFFPSFDALP